MRITYGNGIWVMVAIALIVVMNMVVMVSSSPMGVRILLGASKPDCRYRLTQDTSSKQWEIPLSAADLSNNLYAWARQLDTDASVIVLASCNCSHQLTTLSDAKAFTWLANTSPYCIGYMSNFVSAPREYLLPRSRILVTWKQQLTQPPFSVLITNHEPWVNDPKELFDNYGADMIATYNGGADEWFTELRPAPTPARRSSSMVWQLDSQWTDRLDRLDYYLTGYHRIVNISRTLMDPTTTPTPTATSSGTKATAASNKVGTRDSNANTNTNSNDVNDNGNDDTDGSDDNGDDESDDGRSKQDSKSAAGKSGTKSSSNSVPINDNEHDRVVNGLLSGNITALERAVTTYLQTIQSTVVDKLTEDRDFPALVARCIATRGDGTQDPDVIVSVKARGRPRTNEPKPATPQVVSGNTGRVRDRTIDITVARQSGRRSGGTTSHTYVNGLATIELRWAPMSMWRRNDRDPKQFPTRRDAILKEEFLRVPKPTDASLSAPSRRHRQMIAANDAYGGFIPQTLGSLLQDAANDMAAIECPTQVIPIIGLQSIRIMLDGDQSQCYQYALIGAAQVAIGSLITPVDVSPPPVLNTPSRRGAGGCSRCSARHVDPGDDIDSNGGNDDNENYDVNNGDGMPTSDQPNDDSNDTDGSDSDIAASAPTPPPKPSAPIWQGRLLSPQ